MRKQSKREKKKKEKKRGGRVKGEINQSKLE